MNIAVILAAGVGQRMRNGGLPKQFLKLMGKPIIAYTLEKFELCNSIDAIVIVCHGGYIDQMKHIVELYHFGKVKRIVVGGNDRQSSLRHGLDGVRGIGGADEDIVVIHDGVRPLVSGQTLLENIRVAALYGCAITVHPVTESVVLTAHETAGISDFKKRDETYSLTAPQTFRLKEIENAYASSPAETEEGIPLLDAGMIYANSGGEVHLVKEQNANIKITTPEDYYFSKAILELEESKYIFGL